MVREGLGLRSPIYTNQDVYEPLRSDGAGAFRWRVWAIDQDGEAGEKSPWCQIAFAGSGRR
jgi:hypothetical protein